SIPDGVSATFDSGESKTIKLTKLVDGEVYDEVVMEIPAGSIASSGTITVSITPTVNVKPDSKDKPIGLAYEFEARDSDGNKIESFNSNVTIYINYDEALVESAGYSEESITPKYFDTTTGSWENYSNIIRDTENNQLIIKTNHFSTGGITGGDVPAKPSDLTATAAGSTAIDLAWTDNSSNETGFKIYRGGVLIDTVDEGVITYTDEDLEAETSYAYYVEATNAAGDSSASNTASAATEATTGNLPTAPSGLEATDTTRSTVALSWTDNSSNETGFKVYKNGQLIHTTAANETEYTVSSLSSSMTYSFYVKATNAAGNSASSNTISVETDASHGGGGGSAGSGAVQVPVVEKPVGEMTEAEMIAKIAQLSDLITALQKQIAGKSGTGLAVDGLPASYKFTVKMKPGMQSNDVRYLQLFLKAQGTGIYPEGLVSGYFGPLTKAAVIRFQEKYRTDILVPFGLGAGTGIAGEKTLQKINFLIGR
ncbi:MAG: fibronectin type III domain-containing protein, partial [Candidatus Nealsonbacteria bacterium]|nr:fibronectin type III domain-containing protein [Candidatus Nealsonbacteria bacterium]